MEALELLAGDKTVGTKETLKAIEKNKVAAVFIAKDAENRVVEPVRRACLEKGVKILEVETMAELGHACHLSVGAAACAVIQGD